MIKLLVSKLFKNQYVMLFKEQIGIHKLLRESKNVYVIHDSQANRPRGYLKNKWYIMKIWGFKYGKRRI